MVRQTQLQVVEVEIQAAQHDADTGVEGIARGDGGVVGRGHVAQQGGVGAADVGDLFRVEFVLDAGFAEDEDGAFARGEGEDARDVDGGAVGGAEDFVLLGGEEWSLAVRGDFGRVGKGKGRGGGEYGRVAYHFCRDAHCIQFLLVVGAGFGAVVRDEDYLLACMVGSADDSIRPIKTDRQQQWWYPSPLLRNISRVSTVPSKR